VFLPCCCWRCRSRAPAGPARIMKTKLAHHAANAGMRLFRCAASSASRARLSSASACARGLRRVKIFLAAGKRGRIARRGNRSGLREHHTRYAAALRGTLAAATQTGWRALDDCTAPRAREISVAATRATRRHTRCNGRLCARIARRTRTPALSAPLMPLRAIFLRGASPSAGARRPACAPLRNVTRKINAQSSTQASPHGGMAQSRLARTCAAARGIMMRAGGIAWRTRAAGSRACVESLMGYLGRHYGHGSCVGR